MADDALFNLRWDAQRTALLGSVAALYHEESFVDVTLVSNGQIFKAHKLLLSASSPYLKTILEVSLIVNCYNVFSSKMFSNDK